jgi:hypothetical protein
VNWLGHALDAAKRSQILFMDRDDILNLSVVTKFATAKHRVAGCNPVLRRIKEPDGTMPNRPELPTPASALSAVAQRAGIPCQEVIRYGTGYDDRTLSPFLS